MSYKSSNYQKDDNIDVSSCFKKNKQHTQDDDFNAENIEQKDNIKKAKVSYYLLSYLNGMWTEELKQDQIFVPKQSLNTQLRQQQIIQNFFSKKKKILLQQFQNSSIRITQDWQKSQQKQQISISYESRSSKIMNVKVRVGVFQVSISILNVQNGVFSISEQFQLIAAGSFAEVFYKRVNPKLSWVVKRTYFNKDKTGKRDYPQMSRILLQFAFIKILSCLGIGINYETPFGFEILCFQNYVEFFLEKGEEISQKIDRSNLGKFQKDMQDNLRKLHLLQFVHNDIKPGNILYSNFHKKFVFIDFNISQYLVQPIGYKKSTLFRGTFGYISKQMESCYLKKQRTQIDLYWNDLQSLRITFQQIYKQPFAHINNQKLYQYAKFSNDRIEQIQFALQKQSYENFISKIYAQNIFLYERALLIFLLNCDSHQIEYLQERIGPKLFKDLLFSVVSFFIQYEFTSQLQKNYRLYFLPYMHEFESQIKKQIFLIFSKKQKNISFDLDKNLIFLFQKRYKYLNTSGLIMGRLLSLQDFNANLRKINITQATQSSEKSVCSSNVNNSSQIILYFSFVKYIHCNITHTDIKQVMININKFNQATQFMFCRLKDTEDGHEFIYQVLENLKDFFYQQQKQERFYLIISDIIQVYYQLNKFFPATNDIHTLLQTHESFIRPFKKIIYHYILLKTEVNLYTLFGENHSHKQKIQIIYKIQNLNKEEKKFTQLLIKWINYFWHQILEIHAKKSLNPAIQKLEKHYQFGPHFQNEQNDQIKLNYLAKQIQQFKKVLPQQFAIVFIDIYLQLLVVKRRIKDNKIQQIRACQKLMDICTQCIKGPTLKHYLQNIYELIAHAYNNLGFHQKALIYAKLANIPLFQKIYQLAQMTIFQQKVQQSKKLFYQCIQIIKKRTNSIKVEMKIKTLVSMLSYYGSDVLSKKQIYEAIEQALQIYQFSDVKRTLAIQNQQNYMIDQFSIFNSQKSTSAQKQVAKINLYAELQAQEKNVLKGKQVKIAYQQTKCILSFYFQSEHESQRNLREFYKSLNFNQRISSIQFFVNFNMEMYLKYKKDQNWKNFQINLLNHQKQRTSLFIHKLEYPFCSEYDYRFRLKARFRNDMLNDEFLAEILYTNILNIEALMKFYIKRLVLITQTQQFAKIKFDLMNFIHTNKHSLAQMKQMPQICVFYYFVASRTFQKSFENNLKVLKKMVLMRNNLSRRSKSIINQVFYQILYVYHKKLTKRTQKSQYYKRKCYKEPKCEVYYPENINICSQKKKTAQLTSSKSN